MHMDTTVNNGCLVHFSFAEQVDFLLFPLFWFQPASGMFLPGTFLTLGSWLSMVSRFCWLGPRALDGCVTLRKRPPQKTAHMVTANHLSLSLKDGCTSDGMEMQDVQAQPGPQT